MIFIGIDISKDTFMAAFPKANGYRTQSFKNDTKGILSFIQKLDPEQHHCVMEATGNYGFLLLYLLEKKGIRASMVNPKQIKHFARMMLSVTKTDAKDACLIAMYGEKMNPEVYKMPSETILLLKQKRTAIRLLMKQLKSMKNLREAMAPLPVQDKTVKKTISSTIAFLEHQIETLQDELNNLARKEFDQQIEALTSIKGIGKTLASALVIATGGFSYFENSKQLSRYLGFCPTYQQSGTSVNIRGHINKDGETYLRSQLYVASWVAMRFNAECRNCYLRLRANGKPAKVALVAVVNKLLRQAFAIVTTNSIYIDGYKSKAPFECKSELAIL